MHVFICIVYIYTYMHVFICICIVYIYTYMHVYIYIVYIYTYMHICMCLYVSLVLSQALCSHSEWGGHGSLVAKVYHPPSFVKTPTGSKPLPQHTIPLPLWPGYQQQGSVQGRSMGGYQVSNNTFIAAPPCCKGVARRRLVTLLRVVEASGFENVT